MRQREEFETGTEYHNLKTCLDLQHKQATGALNQPRCPLRSIETNAMPWHRAQLVTDDRP